jgi:prepilin-type N-terminal cleavage/methylation domain-containing protein
MKKAFSLIELSIVILIIGILIAGITQSSRLLSKSQLQSAQILTKSSPVSSIKDLSLWLEPTLPESFGSTELPDDSSAVASWHDINAQAANKNDATQETSANQPLFISKCINGLPCVRFNGVHGATGSMLVSNADIGSPNITFFIVFNKVGEDPHHEESIFGNSERIFTFLPDEGYWFIVYSETVPFGYSDLVIRNDPKIVSGTLKSNVADGSNIFINGSKNSPDFSVSENDITSGFKLAIGNGTAD